MAKARLKSADELRSHNIIGQESVGDIERVAARYAVGITPHVMRTMTGTPGKDPVARQYVPQIQELKILPDELPDPIGDHPHTPVPGIVHRYLDRVLFKIVNVCAVYCRFCFRREMVGPGKEALGHGERKAALDYIRANPGIWEVILTGGDPLVLSARQVSELLDEIESIEHVQVIRIHSRLPVADPKRIDEDMARALTRKKAVYIAVHVNHAQEITPEVVEGFRRLQGAGCMLLSQSVLLKGVNDDAAVLEDLYRRLTALKVKPYYLHHLDRAPGTSHFRVPLARGREIVKMLFSRISGIAMPHYMLDIPGGHGKIPVGSCYAQQREDGWEIEDTAGNKHHYKDEAAQ